MCTKVKGVEKETLTEMLYLIAPLVVSVCIVYTYRIALISWVFNFANLELFAKFIQLKFEPLRCHTYGRLEFVKFFQ